MKRPMTTEELFNRIQAILKEKGRLPDILDYGLAASDSVPIRTYEFSLKNNLDYGGSEGIYLDLWIEYFSNGERRVNDLGTFKTLATGNEAMHIMAGLLADFIIEEHTYVNGNLDDFTWEGADVHPFDENGNKIGWGYTCGSMERALVMKEELLKKYPQVVVRDNATRKEIVYPKREKNQDHHMVATV